jgi:hypothetical protein
MDRREDSSMLSQGLLWRSGSVEWVPSKRAGAHNHLQTGGRYRRWVEKSQGRKILNDPLTLQR